MYACSHTHISLTLGTCIHYSRCIEMYRCASLSISRYVSISRSISLYRSLSLYLSIYISIYRSIYMYWFAVRRRTNTVQSHDSMPIQPRFLRKAALRLRRCLRCGIDNPGVAAVRASLYVELHLPTDVLRRRCLRNEHSLQTYHGGTVRVTMRGGTFPLGNRTCRGPQAARLLTSTVCLVHACGRREVEPCATVQFPRIFTRRSTV